MGQCLMEGQGEEEDEAGITDRGGWRLKEGVKKM